jgi:hypothetical protein
MEAQGAVTAERLFRRIIGSFLKLRRSAIGTVC